MSDRCRLSDPAEYLLETFGRMAGDRRLPEAEKRDALAGLSDRIDGLADDYARKGDVASARDMLAKAGAEAGRNGCAQQARLFSDRMERLAP